MKRRLRKFDIMTTLTIRKEESLKLSLGLKYKEIKLVSKCMTKSKEYHNCNGILFQKNREEKLENHKYVEEILTYQYSEKSKDAHLTY